MLRHAQDEVAHQHLMQLEREAVHWLVRLQSQPSNQRLQQAAQNWRERSLQHQQAWHSVGQSLDQLHLQLQHMPPKHGLVAAQTINLTEKIQNRRRAIIKIAALAILVPTGGWLVQQHLPWQRLVASYSTVTGERRQITLADGTQLQLNTDSAVTLKFNDEHRLLQLERGEIYVITGADSASAQHRPLKVATHNGVIEALGTRFSVRLQAPSDPEACLLCVDHGALRLTPRHTPQFLETSLAYAGDSYLMTSHAVTRLRSGPMQPNSWIKGQLVVSNMELGPFLQEVSRYRPGYLGWSPDVAHLRLSGTYLLEDTTALLRLLVETLPIEVRLHTDYWAYVRPSSHA